ncbi:MAG: hypothetical protein KF784_05735 [Fimbriimonadaceae bacterium]|nr:hypothetical protein [Fimbriimonadaceae bacterium]
MNHEFVESFPESLEHGKLYVSMRYRTAAHLCACGCGRKVVTPIRRGAWKLEFDGESITLFPSIGSSNLPCRSHYFIRDGLVKWLPEMEDIKEKKATQAEPLKAEPEPLPSNEEKTWWKKWFGWLVFWGRL